MESIITILGSSAFVGLITLMLNWAQNRKKNSLSYITEERKLWREKIREIAANIVKSKYNGQNENNIEQYLYQLEMNINPYGRTLSFDYLQDGHMWKVIDEIEKSDSEEEFERNKQLLLGYLSLMLKEDWERSKREVKGYSNAVLYIAIVGIIELVYSFYYINILKLENMEMLVVIQMIIIYTIFLMKNLCIDEMNKLIKNDTRGNVRDFSKRKKRRRTNFISWVLIVVVYMGINIYILESVYPNMIVQQINYYEDEDSFNIYTNLDKKLWTNLELDAEKVLRKDVVIHKLDDIGYKSYASEKYDDMLIGIIQKHLMVWGLIPILLMFAVLLCPLLMDLIFIWDQNKSRLEIDELKYRLCKVYTDDYDQICVFLNRVDLNNKQMKQENRDCFGLIYRLLFKMKRAMKSELHELEGSFCNMQEYERVRMLKMNIESIDCVLHEIEQIQKTIRVKKKMNILKKMQRDIENINCQMVHCSR